MNKPKRILVVGGNGFIGSSFLKFERYLEKYELLSTSRKKSENFVHLDLFNLEACQLLLKEFKPHIVLNFAWNTSHDVYINSEENFEYLASEVAFFELSIKHGVEHYISMGSAAESVVPCSRIGHSEGACNKKSVYALCKSRTNLELTKLHKSSGINFNWVKINQPYGPNQDSRRFAPYVISQLKLGNSIKVQFPDVVNDWITSYDVASALWHLIEIRYSGTVDLGTGVGTSNLEFCENVVSIFGGNADLVEVENKKCNQKSIAQISSNLLFKSGWRPVHSLRSGLEWTILES